MNIYIKKFLAVISFIFLVSELQSSSGNDFSLTTQRTATTILSPHALNVSDARSMLDKGDHARKLHVGLTNNELQNRLKNDKKLHSASTFRNNIDQDNATAQVISASRVGSGSNTIININNNGETKAVMTSPINPVNIGLAKKNFPVQEIMAKKTTVVTKQPSAIGIDRNKNLSGSNHPRLGVFQGSKTIIHQPRIVTSFPRK